MVFSIVSKNFVIFQSREYLIQFKKLNQYFIQTLLFLLLCNIQVTATPLSSIQTIFPSVGQNGISLLPDIIIYSNDLIDTNKLVKVDCIHPEYDSTNMEWSQAKIRLIKTIYYNGTDSSLKIASYMGRRTKCEVINNHSIKIKVCAPLDYGTNYGLHIIGLKVFDKTTSTFKVVDTLIPDFFQTANRPIQIVQIGLNDKPFARCNDTINIQFSNKLYSTSTLNGNLAKLEFKTGESYIDSIHYNFTYDSVYCNYWLSEDSMKLYIKPVSGFIESNYYKLTLNLNYLTSNPNDNQIFNFVTRSSSFISVDPISSTSETLVEDFIPIEMKAPHFLGINDTLKISAIPYLNNYVFKRWICNTDSCINNSTNPNLVLHYDCSKLNDYFIKIEYEKVVIDTIICIDTTGHINYKVDNFKDSLGNGKYTFQRLPDNYLKITVIADSNFVIDGWSSDNNILDSLIGSQSNDPAPIILNSSRLINLLGNNPFNSGGIGVSGNAPLLPEPCSSYTYCIKIELPLELKEDFDNHDINSISDLITIELDNTSLGYSHQELDDDDININEIIWNDKNGILSFCVTKNILGMNEISAKLAIKLSFNFDNYPCYEIGGIKDSYGLKEGRYINYLNYPPYEWGDDFEMMGKILNSNIKPNIFSNVCKNTFTIGIMRKLVRLIVEQSVENNNRLPINSIVKMKIFKGSEDITNNTNYLVPSPLSCFSSNPLTIKRMGDNVEIKYIEHYIFECGSEVTLQPNILKTGEGYGLGDWQIVPDEYNGSDICYHHLIDETQLENKVLKISSLNENTKVWHKYSMPYFKVDYFMLQLSTNQFQKYYPEHGKGDLPFPEGSRQYLASTYPLAFMGIDRDQISLTNGARKATTSVGDILYTYDTEMEFTTTRIKVAFTKPVNTNTISNNSFYGLDIQNRPDRESTTKYTYNEGINAGTAETTTGSGHDILWMDLYNTEGLEISHLQNFQIKINDGINGLKSTNDDLLFNSYSFMAFTDFPNIKVDFDYCNGMNSNHEYIIHTYFGLATRNDFLSNFNITDGGRRLPTTQIYDGGQDNNISGAADMLCFVNNYPPNTILSLGFHAVEVPEGWDFAYCLDGSKSKWEFISANIHNRVSNMNLNPENGNAWSLGHIIAEETAKYAETGFNTVFFGCVDWLLADDDPIGSSSIYLQLISKNQNAFFQLEPFYRYKKIKLSGENYGEVNLYLKSITTRY